MISRFEPLLKLDSQESPINIRLSHKYRKNAEKNDVKRAQADNGEQADQSSMLQTRANQKHYKIMCVNFENITTWKL